MGKEKLNPLLWEDPVGGGPLHIAELAADDSGTTIRGRFAIPRYAKLDTEQARFLETFLRCRGMLSSVEKELGMSYPTVRARLDSLLQALDLTPIKDPSKIGKSNEFKQSILDELERGTITAEQAKRRLKEAAK